MIFRPRRDSGEDPYLELKGALLLVGAALGIFGMVRQRDVLVIAGIAVIAAGVILRLVRDRMKDGEDDNDG